MPAVPSAPAKRPRRRRGALSLEQWQRMSLAERQTAAAGGWLPPIAGADPATDELEALRSLSGALGPAGYAARLERAITAGVDFRAAREALEPIRFAPVVHFRALGDDAEPGTVEAIVAVFGNVDSYGDRMMAGAFTATLQPPPAGRGLPPVVWSHAWDVPPIGPTLEAREVSGGEASEIAGRELGIDGGLYAKYRLLIAEGEDHPTARMVYAAQTAKGGDGRPPLREHSFGFRTTRSRWVEDETEPNAWFGEVREIEEVELYEIGPTLVGANDRTALLAVKSRLSDRRSAALGRKRNGSHEDRSAVVAALSRRRHPATRNPGGNTP